MRMSTTVHDVVDFWRRAGPARWFAKDEAFDAEFRDRFLDAHQRAVRRELDDWADSAEGALALVILLDQFPRNCFRGSAEMFASDALASGVADRAITSGFDRAVDADLRVFFYLPFEHSEDIADQQRAVALCRELGNADYLKYAELHRDVITRFGRFPHRNAVLGRDTTPEEQAFLDAGGFTG
jgi:uncharacterized protein (DUF924 family)